MSAPLGEKLKAVKWGKFKVGDLFEILSYKKRFDANKVHITKTGHPYIVRTSVNNGLKGYLKENEAYLNEGNTISFGQDTATMFYQEKPYFTGDKIKILKPKNKNFNKLNAMFFIAEMSKAFSTFSWGNSSFSITAISEQQFRLPVTNENEIDFSFMETFIRELEEERIRELAAYLTASGLTDYHLTPPEIDIIYQFDKTVWGTFNLEELYGKSTRGKRLKSADRIPGKLIFVTAGEANEGISAYIGNHVEIFSKNTTTIDMFGSAKYRNYEYGADDHVAVVHTENLPKYASIFVTSAIHKAAHTGKFSYAKNFYAKDADELNISLPIKDGAPDYTFMATFTRAVQKLVIKNVVRYSEEKLASAKQIVAH